MNSQVGKAQVPGGRLAEGVISVTDPLQKYALYLPPGYTPDRRWPILFVLDPRGRAMGALKLFEEAASRHRWIVMSSYNSRSDSSAELNVNAMDAMLRSAQERLSIDRSRLYLAGFSGTARAVLRFTVALRGNVAGVIAAGGALGFELGGPETVFAGDSSFAYWGAAGTRDFNYEEVLSMAARFSTTRVPFRVALFDGPHSWPPTDLCTDAVEWLELRAMLGGLRSIDSNWVRAQLDQDLAQAERLEQVGHGEAALRQYEAIARDYTAWPKAGTAAARVRELRNSPRIRVYQSEARHLAERDAQQALDLQKTLQWARSQREAPKAVALVRKLRVSELQELAEHGDSLEAASAQRLLARIFVWLAFYEPRAYLENNSPSSALSMFEAAVRIGPILGESCELLQAALPAATPLQRTALRNQCTPGSRSTTGFQPPRHPGSLDSIHSHDGDTDTHFFVNSTTASPSPVPPHGFRSKRESLQMVSERLTAHAGHQKVEDPSQ